MITEADYTCIYIKNILKRFKRKIKNLKSDPLVIEIPMWKKKMQRVLRALMQEVATVKIDTLRHANISQQVNTSDFKRSATD